MKDLEEAWVLFYENITPILKFITNPVQVLTRESIFILCNVISENISTVELELLIAVWSKVSQ